MKKNSKGQFIKKYDSPTFDESKKSLKAFSLWKDIMNRCYNKKQLDRNKQYINVSVCSEWLDYNNFYKWFQTAEYKDGYELDKDILSGHYKMYSPSTCVFVPHYINSLIKRGKGYSCRKNYGTFSVKVGINGKNKFFGYYKTEEEAKLVYNKVKSDNCKKVALEAFIKEDIDFRAYIGLISKSL